MNGQAVRVRADLEGVALALVDCEEVMPELELRIRQAIRRSGLTSLLEPALEDIERMAADICEAKKSLIAMTTSKPVDDDAAL
jgi:hypothetical protein